MNKRTITLFGIMMCMAFIIAIYFNPVAVANRCFYKAETDGEICKCLHSNGLEDTTFCK